MSPRNAHAFRYQSIVLTGATGALGVPLLAELLRTRVSQQIIALTRSAPERVFAALRAEAPDVDVATLSYASVDLGTADAPRALALLPRSIDCVVHAAACTQFRAPPDELMRCNVEGTRQILAWTGSLPHAPRLVHISTTCVAGERTGEISEAPLTEECGFVNDYERSKWHAEQLVVASLLRPEIVRLATVIGSERDGHLARPGAFHTTLRWLQAGLLPLVPGDSGTRLDLLPTEVVTKFLLRLLARPVQPGFIYHVSAGAHGAPLHALLDLAAERFAVHSVAWRSGQILPPVLATRAAFEDFRATIRKSRDFLFTQILESADSFLPELLHPKHYATTRAEALWGGPLPVPAWRPWITRVIDCALDNNFGRPESAAAYA